MIWTIALVVLECLGGPKYRPKAKLLFDTVSSSQRLIASRCGTYPICGYPNDVLYLHDYNITQWVFHINRVLSHVYY